MLPFEQGRQLHLARQGHYKLIHTGAFGDEMHLLLDALPLLVSKPTSPDSLYIAQVSWPGLSGSALSRYWYTIAFLVQSELVQSKLKSQASCHGKGQYEYSDQLVCGFEQRATNGMCHAPAARDLPSVQTSLAHGR